MKWKTSDFSCIWNKCNFFGPGWVYSKMKNFFLFLFNDSHLSKKLSWHWKATAWYPLAASLLSITISNLVPNCSLGNMQDVAWENSTFRRQIVKAIDAFELELLETIENNFSLSSSSFSCKPELELGWWSICIMWAVMFSILSVMLDYFLSNFSAFSQMATNNCQMTYYFCKHECDFQESDS